MLTISDCFNICPIELSAITTINKLIFLPRKAYVYSYDNETYFDYGNNIAHKVLKLRNRVIKQDFTFNPFRKITRQFKSNKIRDVYLATWQDKIIERWLNDCLNMSLNKWFDDNSYSNRIEDIGLDSCINRITYSIKNNSYFVKRDIANYFYTIDHNILLDKLKIIIDQNDYLYELLRQRIQFTYYENNILSQSTIGIPFGSSIASVLSNIYLTDLDKAMNNFDIKYFRYADDFLMMSKNPDELIKATEYLDKQCEELKLTMKPSHKLNLSFVEDNRFVLTTRFSHLGLEFTKDNKIRMAIEKQRKIINFYKRMLRLNRNKLWKISDNTERLKQTIQIANDVILQRIRSAAIVDYYLKHITDEDQLRNLDRLVAELVICMAMRRERFKKGFFRTIPYKSLRDAGLTSLLHRNRLLRYGRLKVNFLSLYNGLVVKRYFDTISKRQDRVDHIRMARKIKDT